MDVNWIGLVVLSRAHTKGPPSYGGVCKGYPCNHIQSEGGPIAFHKIQITLLLSSYNIRLMRVTAMLLPLVLLTSTMIGCLGDDSNIEETVPIWYKVNCECDTLYVEYTTSDSEDFYYGYVTPDVNGNWVSSKYIFNSGDDIWTELILYAADEDEDNQYRETITATIMYDLVEFESLSRTEVMPDVEVKAYI